MANQLEFGQITGIWAANCIPRNRTMKPIACLAVDPPTMVSELIDITNASWRRDIIEQTFIPAYSNAIFSIPLCTRRIGDFGAWNNEKNGLFSVRSGYRMLVDTKKRREDWLEGRAGSSNYEGEAKSWTTLWSLRVPGKIRNFLWRLAQHSIPTKDVRHKRKMPTADNR